MRLKRPQAYAASVPCGKRVLEKTEQRWMVRLQFLAHIHFRRAISRPAGVRESVCDAISLLAGRVFRWQVRRKMPVQQRIVQQKPRREISRAERRFASTYRSGTAYVCVIGKLCEVLPEQGDFGVGVPVTVQQARGFLRSPPADVAPRSERFDMLPTVESALRQAQA